MKLPWVSRKRFESLLKRYRKLKRIKEELAHAQRVMEADNKLIESQEQKIQELEKQLSSAPAAGPQQPIGARLTYKEAIDKVNREAEQNAKDGGAPIMQQLAEARFRHRGEMVRKKLNG